MVVWVKCKIKGVMIKVETYKHDSMSELENHIECGIGQGQKLVITVKTTIKYEDISNR